MPGGEPAFAAALQVRLGELHGEAAGAVAGWARTLPDLRDRVWSRVEALTRRLRLAHGQALRRLAPAGVPRRQQRPLLLAWLVELDRDRAHVEEEVWEVLRAARREEREVRAQVAARVERLERVCRQLAKDAQRALDESKTSSTSAGALRLSDLELGRQLDQRVKASLAAARAAFELHAARSEAALARLSGRGLVDPAVALAALDRTLATLASAGGEARPAIPLRPESARPAARPKTDRKRAQVPRFLLDRFYRRGGLRASAEGVEITFVNPLGFCIVQQGDPLRVDGRPHPLERTALDNGDRRLRATELSDRCYLKFAKGSELRVVLEGLVLAPGPHRIDCSLQLRKLGWVDLRLEDAAV